MATSYTDQFYIIDPGVPPAPGTTVTVETHEFEDGDDSGTIDASGADTIDGSTVTAVWVGDTVTINVPGVGDVTYVGVTFYSDGVPSYFTPTDGQVLQDGTFVSSTFVSTSTQVDTDDLRPVCFTLGTMIDTPSGPRLVDDLRAGDLVTTRDHGAQPLAAVISKQHEAVGPAAPVVIREGAMGNARELVLSQQHRLLIDDARAELLFGLGEVLVAAVHLVDGESVVLRPGGTITYVHLVFERHEIVTAEGIPAESYCPDHVLRGGSRAAAG